MKKIITIFMLFLIIGVNTNIYAETISDMQANIDATQAEYDQKAAELEDKQVDADTLADEITQTQADIETTKSEITSTQNDISESELEIQDLEENQIPVMESRAKVSLQFTQHNNNTNFLMNSIMIQTQNEDATSNDILGQAHSAQKITEETAKSVDELSKTLAYVNEQKIELQNEEDSLKVKQTELSSQQDYLKAAQDQLSQEVAEIEGDMKASQDEIAAQEEKEKLYEDAGCGPNDVYGVDCANDKIENTAPSAGGSGFSRPTDHGYISNEYGSSDYYSTGFHSGIDIANSAGTPIHPSAPGVVLYSGWTDDGGGNSVVVLHLVGDQNYVTRYAHMSSTNVSAGDSVTTDSVLGSLGSTGNSSGPHCHFEIEQGSTYVWSALENPRNYVDFPAMGVWW